MTKISEWQHRVEFYGAKWEAYHKRFPNRWHTKATVQRWVRECNETKREEVINDA